MESGLNFGGYESNYASNKKSNFRKAGDAFTTASNREPSQESSYSKWMSFMGKQSSNSSNNSNTTTNSNNSQTISNTNASAPESIQSTVGQSATPAEDIDYGAWAADTVAKQEAKYGKDYTERTQSTAEFWENAYRRQNNENAERKAMMESHQGPKTWDDVVARAQSRIPSSGSGRAADASNNDIADYNSYTKYTQANHKSKQYEEAASKWRL